MIRKSLFFILVLGAFQLRSEIVWQAARIEQEADLFTGNMAFAFFGRNAGGAALEIESLKASCSCLQVSSDKTVVQPGEELAVVGDLEPFEIGGTQRQEIWVHIKGRKAPERLTVVAKLPEIVSFSRKHLFWKPDSAAEAQSVAIRLGSQKKVELLDAYAMDENYTTELERVSEHEYTLSVRPEDLSIRRPARVLVRVSVEGRRINAAIPCVIDERNPAFEWSYRPLVNSLRRPDFKEIEASLLRHPPIDPIRGGFVTPPALPQTETPNDSRP